MNELSLFTGAGGGLLGSRMLGWRTVGYVEWDDYCQRVLAARINDGLLDPAPIFGDVRTFVCDGYAASYQGMVDVVTAGFPCQPFSVAGKRAGEADERNMWPATLDFIRIVRPALVLLENVRGIIRTYLPVVIRDLRRQGYEVEDPRILGADDVGACHHRQRVWIFAHAFGVRLPRIPMWESARPTWHDAVATEPFSFLEWSDGPGALADFPRMDDGVAHRMDRLKAIGNGQVPLCMATAFRMMTEADAVIEVEAGRDGEAR